MSLKSASGIPTGIAGCSAGRRDHSTLGCISNSASSRTFPAGLPISGTATVRAWSHFYLDTFIPDDTVANGGIFAWHDVRENPDTFQCLSTFASKQVLYSYSTTFGSGYGDHTIIRGTHGTLWSPGGEGSPQWWFEPEKSSGWRSNRVFEFKPGVSTKAEPVLLPGQTELRPVSQSDDLAYHTDNWLHCMRSGKTPNGNIETGFAHAVAVIMATRAYREGKKVYWDRRKEEIDDQPAA